MTKQIRLNDILKKTWINKQTGATGQLHSPTIRNHHTKHTFTVFKDEEWVELGKEYQEGKQDDASASKQRTSKKRQSM